MTTVIVKKTIGELSEDTLKLQGFFTQQQPGTLLSYHEIETATGVLMTQEGKSRLRSALNGLKKEYSVIRGEGIRLADEHTAMSIVSSRITKIDRTVRRADKSQRRLQADFLDKMTPQSQKQMLFAGAVFGAIRLAAEQGRQLHKQKQLTSFTQSSLSIPIPLLN